MNKGELREYVRGTIRRDVSAVSDEMIDNALDWSQREIASLHTFPEMRKEYGTHTLLGPPQKLYNYPPYPTTGSLKDIVRLRIEDPIEDADVLTYFHERKFDQLVPRPYTLGVPTSYTDRGEYLQLHPVPDRVFELRMRCSVFPPLLEADYQSPLLINKDLMITAGAIAILFMLIKEEESAEYWRRAFGVLFQSSKAGDRVPLDWEPVARPFVAAGRSPLDPTNPMTGR